MRTLVFTLLLLVCTGSACLAQPTVSATPSAAAPAAVPDSVRQAVHKLFKQARLLGALSTVSGGLVASSNTVDAAKGDRHWSTIGGLVLGTNALVIGTINLIRFSPRRERQVLAALERGQPMPKYVARSLPLLARY